MMVPEAEESYFYIHMVCMFIYTWPLLHHRPNAFAVITPSRVFNLISDSSAEMHMWIGGTVYIV